MAFARRADSARVRRFWALPLAGCRLTVASQHLSKLRFAGLVDATAGAARALPPTRRPRPSAAKRSLFQAARQVSSQIVHNCMATVGDRLPRLAHLRRDLMDGKALLVEPQDLDALVDRQPGSRSSLRSVPTMVVRTQRSVIPLSTLRDARCALNRISAPS